MRHIAYSLLIVTSFIFTLFIIHGKDTISFSPRIVTIGSGVPEIVVVEEQRQVYRIWKDRGFHGRIAVHFDNAMDTKPFGYMKRRFANGFFLGITHPFSEDELDNGNFMFFAMANGFVREVVGVIPEGIYLSKDKDLRDSGYFNYGDRYMSMVFGIPKTVTTVKNLSAIEEPVLLDLDPKFFSNSDIEPEEIYNRLRLLKIKTDLVTFSVSAGGKDVSPEGVEKMKRLIGLLQGI